MGDGLAKTLKKVTGEVEQALEVLLPLPEGAEARLAEAMRVPSGLHATETTQSA